MYTTTNRDTVTTTIATNEFIFVLAILNKTIYINHGASVCEDERTVSDSGSSISNDYSNYDVNVSTFVLDGDKDESSKFYF